MTTIDVRARMRNDKLSLNDDKTEFLVIGTEQQLSKVFFDKISEGWSWQGNSRIFSVQLGRLV